MKELTIEEKAQRYDEAIKFAKIYHNSGDEDMKTMCKTMFPELKESEDDEIRKSIIAIITNYVDNSNTFKPKMIAWLEKQSTPQVRTGLEWVNTIDDACDKRYSEEYAHGEYCHEQSFKWGFQEGVDWLEEQGEQKPTNKVEPKFHEGEWIIGANNVFKIISLNDELNCYIAVTPSNEEVKIPYQFDDGQGHMCSYHLWTIEDAKDGDVLATDLWLFMFKYTNNKDLIQFHCKCPINGTPYKWCWLSDDSYLDIYIDTNIHPATKEQRDLLFQKMHEAGYKWDAEKKELKKIKQNPAWSEEDEKKFSDILTLLWGGVNRHYNASDLSTWFKSLKERVQPKQWNEDTQQWIDTIIKDYEEWYDADIDHRATIQIKINILKSLRPKSQWKPSDEQVMALRWVLNHTPYDSHKEEISGLLEQLKKLKDEK